MTTTQLMTQPTAAETSGEPTGVPVRLDIDTHAPTFVKALGRLDEATTRELDRSGIDAGLRELLRVRASQINGCAYCVDMHSTDARAVGEANRRIDALPVWRETPYFTPAERSALAFVEAVVTTSTSHGVADEAYDDVDRHFSPDQVGALVALVVTVTAWNGVGVSTHAWEPGSYAP